jgi:hypothetical protein
MFYTAAEDMYWINLMKGDELSNAMVRTEALARSQVASFAPPCRMKGRFCHVTKSGAA